MSRTSSFTAICISRISSRRSPVSAASSSSPKKGKSRYIAGADGVFNTEITENTEFKTGNDSVSSAGSVLNLLTPHDLDRLDRHRLDRAIAGLARRHLADLLHDVHARDHFAEDAVLVVEPRRGCERDEELAAVGVRTGIGHRQN